MNTGKVSHKNNGKTIKVLIAEDNTVSAKILKKNILNWGYEVVLAKNGEEAWLALKKEEIKLAILDWMMPKFSGIQLCQKIRKTITKRTSKIILISSFLRPKMTRKTSSKAFQREQMITLPNLFNTWN
jgi:DNA-binding response OmpR family regulator